MLIVEGPTEEAFANTTLRPHLAAHGVYLDCRIVHPRQLGSRRKHRGGGGWPDWAHKIANALRDTRLDLRFTTLFDLYGLPRHCPGRAVAADLDHGADKAAHIEAALSQHFGDPRLTPYIQVHEFEALVLASLDGLETQLDAADDLKGLAKLRAKLGRQPPEDINDGPDTAPSKRLRRAIPSYEKVIHGPGALDHAGLSHLRQSCPRFAAWLAHLERLGG